MLSKGFRIVSPKTFEINIESVESKEGYALVQMKSLAICKADLRYYLGNRDERILGLKYPMRLIHEATGVILKDINNNFKKGDTVVLVPNICECRVCDFEFKADKTLGVNYCPKVKFASSNFDGFASECISFPIKNLVKYNNEIIHEDIAVFSELISVALSAIRRIDSIENKTIGIWGDGILGYIISNVLKVLSNNSKIISIGTNRDKLDKFNVDETYLATDKEIKNLKIDLAFECVGGKNAEKAINQIIETMNFGGEMVLTGVSEEGASINTRRILEKAVRITGSTRSSVEDFKEAIELLNRKDFREKIEKLILSVNEVENIVDYYDVFEKEVSNFNLGKHVINLKL